MMYFNQEFQSFQECLAPSSKPLLARASGKGLVCQELVRKFCWNYVYMFCHFMRQFIVFPFDKDNACKSTEFVCCAQKKWLKNVNSVKLIGTNCCLSHRRESAMSSTISHSRVMSQSKNKSSWFPCTTCHWQIAFRIAVTNTIIMSCEIL